MISERELDLNGWERVERRYRMRVASRVLPFARVRNGRIFFAEVRRVNGSVEQRLNRGWWDAHCKLKDERTGVILEHVHHAFRTARAAMAWLQGEPWRRG